MLRCIQVLVHVVHGTQAAHSGTSSSTCLWTGWTVAQPSTKVMEYQEATESEDERLLQQELRAIAICNYSDSVSMFNP
uniref:Secreted protein n=1 Tax=Babesia bovis TaxID=5865 RepID=S6B5G0_BABBO|nr:hypothetical protein [Babesia bovis]